MRLIARALIFSISIAIAACSSGPKGPTPIPALPDASTNVRANVATASFATIYQFPGGAGGQTSSRLTVNGGAFYGVTRYGRSRCKASTTPNVGCDVIYRLTRQGQYTVFASFDIEKRNGTALLGGLTEWQGTFYGIAGAARGYSIYSIGADHERAVAHIPSKNQISGDLVGLGTTLYGVFGNPNDGAVYSVDRGGKFRVVYAFKGGTDAAFPIDVVAHNGTLYGIALEGDAVRCRCASIFSVTPSGKERVLYRFKGVQRGEVPVPSLSFDSQGNLYGAAAPYLSYGDCPYSHVRSCGSVFEIAHAGLGRFTVLHQFHGGSDGMTPNGNLILDSADNIFGTTEYGGGGPCPALGCGTIYELKRSEGTYSERMIHTFSGSGDGALPTMGLL